MAILIPILRIFDEVKARDFYLDYLDCKLAFEHRFETDAPIYIGVLFENIEIHLSEHHGDGTPGSFLRIEVGDIEAFHARLSSKSYRFAKPNIQRQDWGFREVAIADPFANKLIFCEPDQSILQARKEREMTHGR